MSNGGRDRAAPSNRRSRSNAAMPANLDPPPRLSIPEEPPKVPRRPPSKGNKRETLADIAKRIPVQLMRQYFNYPLRSAAEAMHISVTTLKRLCRRHGVKRWPHRQISGINRALNDLENQHQAAGDGDCGAVADQLRQLHRRREVIIELAFESDEEASRKGSADAPPPAAHKRGHRATASSDSNGSTNSSASSTAPSSPRPRSDSLVEAPKSPGSATSVGGDSKPTAAWWQSAAAPGSGDDSALSGGGICKALGDSSASSSVASSTAAEEAVGVEADAAAAAVGVDARAAAGVGAGAGTGSAGGVRRPRRPSGTATAGSTVTSTSSRGGGGGSGSSKTARSTQRSSAMFGNIPRPGKARTTAHRRRKSGNDIAPAVTGAVRRYSVSAPSTSPVAFAGGVPSPAAPSRMSVGGGGGVGGGGAGAGGGMGMGIPACHQLPAAVAGVAAVSGRPVCGSMFDQGVQVNQQMDDLAALGDLLFGPDETAAAAAAEAKGNGFLAAYPDIFAPSTSQQWTAPYVPFCPPGVFSHDQSLLGAPSSFASHDPGFLTGMAFSSWGGLGSERHGLGAPPSSVGPL